jgi:hypothetical protein
VAGVGLTRGLGGQQVGFASTTVYQKIGLSLTESTSEPAQTFDKNAPLIPQGSLYYSVGGWGPANNFYSPLIWASVETGNSEYIFYTFSTSIEQTTQDASLVDDATPIILFNGLNFEKIPVEIQYKPYVWESNTITLSISPDTENEPVTGVGGAPQTGTFQYSDSDQTVTPVVEEGEPDNFSVTDTSGGQVDLTSAQISDLKAAILSAVTEAPEAGNASSGSIDWTFNPTDPTLVSLVPAGATLVVSIPIEVTDSQNSLEASSDLVLTIQGSSAKLFTAEANTVDFNKLTSDQQAAIAGGADLYDGLGGDDVVTLPSVANYNESVGDGKTLGWTDTAASTFYTGSKSGDTYTIDGSSGDKTILGGAGQETFDYTAGDFANYAQFQSGDTDTITGGHSAFQNLPATLTTPTTQNVIKLPGSPNNYSISVNYNGDDSFSTAETKITTNGTGGLPDGIAIDTTGIEDARFTQPVGGVDVDLTGGTVAAEMLQLAAEVYGPNPTLSHQEERSPMLTKPSWTTRKTRKSGIGSPFRQSNLALHRRTFFSPEASFIAFQTGFIRRLTAR